jgi:voltage-gated potassium channel
MDGEALNKIENQEEEYRDRYELLHQIDDIMDMPMAFLGFIWFGLLVYELIWGLTPILDKLTITIWIIFILDFIIDLVLAPNKLRYLKGNWLMVIALIVPAFRAFRIFTVLRYAGATRGLTFTRVVGSLNRGMKGLRVSMGRRGLGYVLILTMLVTVGGSAGIYALERGANPEMRNYGDALWFAAMMMTTMGSDFWPITGEGRVLAFMMGVYAFTVFGYVTAALAGHFVSRDVESGEKEQTFQESIEALRSEVVALRSEVKEISERLREDPGGKR